MDARCSPTYPRTWRRAVWIFERFRSLRAMQADERKRADSASDMETATYDQVGRLSFWQLLNEFRPAGVARSKRLGNPDASAATSRSLCIAIANKWTPSRRVVRGVWSLRAPVGAAMSGRPGKQRPLKDKGGNTVADDAPSTPGPFDITTIQALVGLMGEHDLSEIDLRSGEQRITLRRGVPPAAPVAANLPLPAPAAVVAPAPA